MRGGRSAVMQRFAFWTLIACSGLVCLSCAGSLSNPEDFADAGTGTKTVETVFVESCGQTGCHDAPRPPQHTLDLVSPDIESRVVGVNAIAIGCEDEILVVAGDPESSYLLDKILFDSLDICGVQMPVIGLLSESDIDIIEEWIIDLGGSGGGTPDGG